MRRRLNVKRVILVTVIFLAIIAAVLWVTLFKDNSSIIELGATKTQLLTQEEEKIKEVEEEIIKIAVDTTIDEPLGEIMTINGQEVEIPKSTVAEVNSAEDAEKNKKTGGDAVSQSQAETMFENVGTKSFGIDVSAHQGAINWSQVKNAGVDFAIIRCGFRGQTSGGIYEDKYFKSNVAGATAAGIKVGIYFYSTAVNEQEALEEAVWVISKIKTYRITYPVVYDFEDFGAYRCKNVGGQQATSNALTYLNAVASAGYEPMMYANKSDITTRMSRGSFGCKFWLAHYTSQTNYSGSYQMWQYTSRGSVAGISGNVDMDIAYFSYGATAEAKHTHDFSELVKDSTVAATCTKDGSKVMRCSCGDTETVVIEKLGHSFGEWITTKVPADGEDGEETRTCSTCGYEDKRVITSSSNSNTVVNNTTNTNTNTSTDTNTVNNETNTNPVNNNTTETPVNNTVANETPVTPVNNTTEPIVNTVTENTVEDTNTTGDTINP